MCRSLRNSVPWLLVLLLAASTAPAEQSRGFQEGRSGGGQLKYINDLPVLIVAGTPEEIGRQKAALTGEVVKKLVDYPRQLLPSGRTGKIACRSTSKCARRWRRSCPPIIAARCGPSPTRREWTAIWASWAICCPTSIAAASPAPR